MSFFTLEGQVRFINKVVPYFVMSMVIIMSCIAGFTFSHSALFAMPIFLIAVGAGLSYIWFRENIVKQLEREDLVRNG